MIAPDVLKAHLHPNLIRFLRKRKINCYAEFLRELSEQLTEKDLEFIKDQNAMFPLTTLLRWHDTQKGSAYWANIAKKSIEYQTNQKII